MKVEKIYYSEIIGLPLTSKLAHYIYLQVPWIFKTFKAVIYKNLVVMAPAQKFQGLFSSSP